MDFQKNNSSHDLDWIMQSQQVSDTQLLQVLFQEFSKNIYRLGIFLLGDEAKARELVENTLTEITHQRRHFWANTSLKAWIYANSVKAYLDKQVQKKSLRGRDRNLFKSLQPFKPLQELDNCLTEDQQLIAKSFYALPGDHALVLFLRFLVGLDVTEISYTLQLKIEKIINILHSFRQEMLQLVTIQEQGQLADLSKKESSLYWRSEKHLANEGMRFLGVYVSQSDFYDRDGKNSKDTSCMEIDQTQIQAVSDGYLDEQGKNHLKGHLHTCSKCRAYAASLLILDATITGFFQAQYPVPDLPKLEKDSQVTRLESEVVKIRKTKWVTRLVTEVAILAAVFALIAGLASTIKPGNAETPTPNSGIISNMTEADSSSVLPTQQSTNTTSLSLGITALSVPLHPGALESGSKIPPAYTLIFPRGSGDILPDLTSTDIPLLSPNLSGPVFLRKLIRYWGGNQNPIPYLITTKQNKAIMFFDLINYVNGHTELTGLWRVGGEITHLRELISNGFPVLVEIGEDNSPKQNWTGRYVVLSGYDDDSQVFTLLDTGTGSSSGTTISYDMFTRAWRAFNYSYMVVYPVELKGIVRTLLGDSASSSITDTYEKAASIATAETMILSDQQDRFFAWFNKGTSLAFLNDYIGASAAYDEAFRLFWSLPDDSRPWRILWYQTRPFWAYYYSDRYQDVISLADNLLKYGNLPNPEEAYYWRGMAREAQGDTNGAISDLAEAVRLDPNFFASQYELYRLLSRS